MKQARTLDPKRTKQAIDACKSDRELAMILLSLKAGLRAKEIAGLTWDRVDLDGKTLLLTTTKGDKPRNVPMNSELAVVLKRLKVSAKKPHVFTNQHSNPGKPLTPNAVACWFSDFFTRRLGWTGYSSHSGRRTFCTNAAKKIVEAKGSLRDVQALMGHASLAMTQRYVDTDEDAQKRVVDLI